jgi:hypothetical protein
VDDVADPHGQRLRPGPLPRGAPKPVKLTISVPAEFATRLRDAVFALRELGRATTLTGLIVDACDERLDRLADECGGAIPSRGDQNLQPGPLVDS